MKLSGLYQNWRDQNQANVNIAAIGISAREGLYPFILLVGAHFVTLSLVIARPRARCKRILLSPSMSR